MKLENKSGITPVGVSVLVLPEQVEEKTESGIITVTEKEKDRHELGQTDALVIAIGEAAYFDEKVPRCKVGDRVIMAKYSGMIRKGNDDLTYRLIRDSDVLAILDKGNEQ